MAVNFDLIMPMPTADQQRRSQALRLGRKARQERAAEVRRAQLLEVAWELLKMQGVAGFNMRELGHRAGYTAGAMYGYFASRDHILQALRQRLVEEVALVVAQIRSRRRVQRSATTPPLARPGSTLETCADEAANARQRFLLRSEAWWNKLTQEAFAIPLLLLPGSVLAADNLSERLIEAGAATWTPLEALEQATQPCVDDLEMAGWAPKAAWRVHREALFLGVGLATLGSRSIHGRESEGSLLGVVGFRSTLERWLAHGEGQPAAQMGVAGSGQHDLFAG